MSASTPQESFQVRDRRRRSEEPAPGPAAEPERPRFSEPPPPGPDEEPNLVGLFVMLASFAVAALDGIDDPATGQRHRDAPQAAELIDLLLLLRQKTEGHRTAGESEALEAVIYDLQVRYVRATTRPE